MDRTAAQLRRAIVQTRQRIDEKLAQLRWRVQQTVQGAQSTATDVINHGLMASARRRSAHLLPNRRMPRRGTRPGFGAPAMVSGSSSPHAPLSLIRAV